MFWLEALFAANARRDEWRTKLNMELPNQPWQRAAHSVYVAQLIKHGATLQQSTRTERWGFPVKINRLERSIGGNLNAHFNHNHIKLSMAAISRGVEEEKRLLLLKYGLWALCCALPHTHRWNLTHHDSWSTRRSFFLILILHTTEPHRGNLLNQ